MRSRLVGVNWGGSEIVGGVSRTFLGHLRQVINIFLQLKPNRLAPLLVDLITGGGLGAWS
jgi:hypothetical protein